jgi:hypothetical protein
MSTFRSLYGWVTRLAANSVFQLISPDEKQLISVRFQHFQEGELLGLQITLAA